MAPLAVSATWISALEDAIRIHVRRVYEKYAQNITRAAEALGVSRNTARTYL